MATLQRRPPVGADSTKFSVPHTIERSRTKSDKTSQTDVYITALVVSVLLRAGQNLIVWAKDSRVMPSLSLSTAKTAAIFALKTCAFTAGLALVGRAVLVIENIGWKSQTDTAKKIKHLISAVVVGAVTYTLALPYICAVVAIGANIVATQSKTQRIAQDNLRPNSSPPLPNSNLSRNSSSSSSSSAPAAAGSRSDSRARRAETPTDKRHPSASPSSAAAAAAASPLGRIEDADDDHDDDVPASSVKQQQQQRLDDSKGVRVIRDAGNDEDE